VSLNTLAWQAIEDRAARTAVAPAPGPPMGAAPAPSREDALSSISKYIPTEVVTLFMFGISLPLAAGPSWLTVKTLYWGLLAFTPLCFWLLFAAKFRAKSPVKAWPTWGQFPWWQCVGGVIGFAVWAPAVPKSGLLAPEYGPWIAFAALMVSTALSLCEPLVEP
jgi:hypothetical protein